jgi:ribosomal RNA-processing protein 1
LPKRNVIPFLRAFWQTMAREWTNIDVLRMEKFLLLTRRVVGTAFAYLQSKGWDEELVKEHLALLEEIPLNGPDHKLPNGMRYHVIDIYIDELQKIGAVDGDDKEAEDKEAPLPTLLEPLKKLEKESPTKAVRVKCKEALADERLPKSVKPEEEEGSDDGEWGGIDG